MLKARLTDLDTVVRGLEDIDDLRQPLGRQQDYEEALAAAPELRGLVFSSIADHNDGASISTALDNATAIYISVLAGVMPTLERLTRHYSRQLKTLGFKSGLSDE